MKGPRWPTLPRLVQGAGGPIRVSLVKHVKSDDGADCWGTWCEETRTVRLDRTALRQHQWKTLWHELTHAALDDAGLDQLLTDDGNESVCKAIASSRMAQMIAEMLAR